MLVRIRTPRVLVKHILASAPREVRQLSKDILVTPQTDLVDGPEVSAERAFADVKQMLAGTESIEFESAEIGSRPIPEDGLPIVGFVPEIEGLYLTVMHPGVNLAPAIGRLAAVEILDGISVSLLDACRPKRFLDRQSSASPAH